MFKNTLTVLVSVLAIAGPILAFGPAPLAKSSGTSRPGLEQCVAAWGSKKTQTPRSKDAIVARNALREFANWNDVWDGDYYGGYGSYGRRGYGGMRLRRDIPSRDVSSYPVRSGSDVWRDDFLFPYRSYGDGWGYGGLRSRRYARDGYYDSYYRSPYGYGRGDYSYSNMNNYPELRSYGSRRRYSRDYYPYDYSYGGGYGYRDYGYSPRSYGYGYY